MSELKEQVRILSLHLQKTEIAEYVQLMDRPVKLLFRNLLAGIIRGVGIAVGFTVFMVTLLYILRWLDVLNIPIIGEYISEIVKVVQAQLEGGGYRVYEE